MLNDSSSAKFLWSVFSDLSAKYNGSTGDQKMKRDDAAVARMMLAMKLAAMLFPPRYCRMKNPGLASSTHRRLIGANIFAAASSSRWRALICSIPAERPTAGAFYSPNK